MKINDTQKSAPAVAPAHTSTAGARSAEKSAVNPGSTESVHLSSQGQALATSAVGDSAVFDTKKVERIKLAIADGQFQVRSDKVADAMLETARDMLQSRKQ